MSAIHLVLQGKGGVGKSLVAALLAQYLSANKAATGALLCADTDPVNDTFARYGAFGAQRIQILNADKNIDSRAFDALIETVLAHEGNCVIDNGASTFIPLSAYLKENSVVELLQEAGKKVFIHTVLTGGQAMDDTLMGLNALVASQGAPVVVWENEFFGEVARDGRRFADSKLYEKNKARIAGIVTLHKRNADTFGKDMELLVSNKLTFDEAMASPVFSLMPRKRLKIIQISVFEQLAALAPGA
jgi:cellulose biosynthesis protein BcsQ